MTISAIEVAYRVTCEQAEYAGSVSSKWVNGFLYVVASEYAKEKNQAPFFEKFHTYTTGPVIPATRLQQGQGPFYERQLRQMPSSLILSKPIRRVKQYLTEQPGRHHSTSRTGLRGKT